MKTDIETKMSMGMNRFMEIDRSWQGVWHAVKMAGHGEESWKVMKGVPYGSSTS